MADQLLTVSMFVSASEAEAARLRLQAEGIEAQTVSQQPGGGSRHAVQVAEADFSRAMSVLFPVPSRQVRAALSKTVAMPPPWTCSGCGVEVMGISETCWSCGRSRAAPSAPPATAAEPPHVVPEPLPVEEPAASEPPAQAEAAAGAAATASVETPPPAESKASEAALAARSDASPESVEPAPAEPVVAPPAADAVVPAARPRFAAVPPPWMAAAPPAPEPPTSAAVPRFANLRPVADETAEAAREPAAQAVDAPPAAEARATASRRASSEESRAAPLPAVEAVPAAGDVAPQAAASAQPAETSETTAPLEPEVLTVPISPEALRRRDRQAESLAREAENMAVRAWWASVVALVLWPVYIYSFWLLLTLSFARVPLSRRGRWCFWAGWAVSVAATTAIFLLVKSRE